MSNGKYPERIAASNILSENDNWFEVNSDIASGGYYRLSEIIRTAYAPTVARAAMADELAGELKRIRDIVLKYMDDDSIHNPDVLPTMNNSFEVLKRYYALTAPATANEPEATT